MLTLVVWLHLTAAAVWVGSQCFIGLVAIPALRAAPDAAVRLTVLRVLTTRYAYLGWACLIVLAATGLYRLPFGGYGSAIQAKLLLGAAILLLTAVHTWVAGPRLLYAMEHDTPARLPLARLSLSLSAANLLLSLAVLWVVAGLRGGGT